MSPTPNTPAIPDDPSTALAVIEANYPAIFADDDTIALIEENLGGEINETMLTTFKLPPAGGQHWSIPSMFGDDEVSKALDVVIIGQMVRRAMWFDELGKGSSGTEPPVCTAQDVAESKMVGHANTEAVAKHPKTAKGDTLGMPGGQCTKCAYAQFGSKPDGGNQQWCRMARVLMVVRPNELLPSLVRLPATSNRAFLDYSTKLVVQGIKLSQVVTQITLEKDKSEGGVDYSRAVFSVLEKLPDEAAAAFENYRVSRGYSTLRQVAAESDALLRDDVVDAEEVE